MEFVINFIVGYVFSFPGAFIRWGINGFKKGELKIYLKKRIAHNYLIFVIFIGIIVAIIQFSNVSFRQKELSCRQQIANGQFVYLDSLEGNTLIERNEEFQIENQEKSGLKIKLKINWITDCKYTLQFVEIMENPNQLSFPPNFKDIILTVEVLSISKEAYIAVSSSNISKERVEGTILIR